MVPAAENQLGRDVAPLAGDGEKNHEEAKVGQGASTIDHNCRYTLSYKKCLYVQMPKEQQPAAL